MKLLFWPFRQLLECPQCEHRAIFHRDQYHILNKGIAQGGCSHANREERYILDGNTWKDMSGFKSCPCNLGPYEIYAHHKALKKAKKYQH